MKGIFLFLIVFVAASCESPNQEVITWKIENMRQVGGNSVTVHGDPEIVEGEEKKFVEFDGNDDGLLVNANPIAGMEEFTIEVDLNPYSGFPENREQRFLHIQDPNNENRRILIELRLNDRDEWYGDWFIKSENESLTLIDSAHTHPVNEWYTISMVYSNGNVRGYINGQKEVSGSFQYLPIDENAKTSIGTRLDKRSWFNGAIKEVRFAPEADFLQTVE